MFNQRREFKTDMSGKRLFFSNLTELKFPSKIDPYFLNRQSYEFRIKSYFVYLSTQCMYHTNTPITLGKSIHCLSYGGKSFVKGGLTVETVKT